MALSGSAAGAPFASGNTGEGVRLFSGPQQGDIVLEIENSAARLVPSGKRISAQPSTSWWMRKEWRVPPAVQ
jgi:hypothetical protein